MLRELAQVGCCRGRAALDEHCRLHGTLPCGAASRQRFTAHIRVPRSLRVYPEDDGLFKCGSTALRSSQRKVSHAQCAAVNHAHPNASIGFPSAKLASRLFPLQISRTPSRLGMGAKKIDASSARTISVDGGSSRSLDCAGDSARSIVMPEVLEDVSTV